MSRAEKKGKTVIFLLLFFSFLKFNIDLITLVPRFIYRAHYNMHERALSQGIKHVHVFVLIILKQHCLIFLPQNTSFIYSIYI